MAKRVVIPNKPQLDQVMSSKLIGDSVRFVRASMGMTIEDAALLCGISKQSLNDLELGKPGCRMSTVLKVMHLMGIEMNIELPNLKD